MKLRQKTTWSFEWCSLYVQIAHWGMDEGINEGKGKWNYYITLPESLLKDKFAEVWLEDKPIKFFEMSPVRIIHDYNDCSFNQVDWHGGVTYYVKHGHTEGHRSVELGCDYNHLWDHERGFNTTLEEVLSDARRTATQLAELYGIKPKE